MSSKKNINEVSKILPHQKTIYGIILFIAVIWCAGILIAPLWAEQKDFRGDVSIFLYNAFSKNCHQDSERSMFISGHQLGVCSRCTLIYFSFLLSTIVYSIVRRLNNTELPALWILLAGAALVGIDAGLDIFNIVKNTFISREITGAILGLILPFYIIPGSIRLFDEYFSSSKVIPKK
jgi:uncharacterized membrane protein